MKLLRRALAGLLVLAVFVLLAAWLWLRSSIPSTHGVAAIAGLGAPVGVAFDSLGIPTLSALSESDLYQAQGFIHARDRFWQMDLLRRAAEGRLAELFGERAVSVDQDARDWEIGRIAHEAWEQTPPADRALLSAYARGVNAWLASGGASLEHRLLRVPAEPWREEDSYAIVLLEARQLHNAGDEGVRREVIARYGPGADSVLLHPYPDSAPTVLPPPGRSGSPALRNISALPLPAWRQVQAQANDARGSNSWAVSSSRSRSGFPLLANDPHLPLSVPSIWYLSVLHAPGLDVEGASIPGVPGVIIGRNRFIAWGITASYVDDVDDVPEQLSADSSRVRRPGGWIPVTIVTETLQVHGKGTVTWQRRRTTNGPILRAAPGASSQVVARRWTGQDVEPAGLLASIALPRATDWEGFRRALRPVRAPSLGMTYADRHGHIGYQLAGGVPRRVGGLPGWAAPGWSTDSSWAGYVPFDSVPASLDPAPFVVTSNNRIAGAWYPYFLSSAWASPYRAERISSLLGEAPLLDATSLGRIQMDVTSDFALAARPIALRAATVVGDSAAIRLLRDWNGRMDAGLIAPSLFWRWYRGVDDAFREYPGGAPATWPTRHGWLFSGVISPARGPATRTDSIVVRMMRAAIADPASRRPWGEVHRLLQRHPLGDLPLLGRLLRFNIGPVPASGGDYTIDLCTSSGAQPPYTCTEGPSLRFVADLGDTDGAAGFILPAGQSGNPLSPHYRDQFPLWEAGRTARLTLTARAGSAATLVLRPEQ